MILADTSVWINHLDKPSEVMSRLLLEDRILLHPFVIGEVALGNLRNRHAILASLQKMPTLPVTDESDVLTMITSHNLFGSGVGYVDCHLLSSVALAKARLWTSDKRLAAAATKMNVSI
jgi:predicted nucleic acid-binding protein